VTTTLPAHQTLYARIWAKVSGVWRYTDSTFSAAPFHGDDHEPGELTGTITYPANGAIDADMTQLIRWTSVAHAQAYYLYIGSTVGAKDLVNTGEIQRTSYRVTTTLPAHQTLYARIWAKVSGVWRYTDSTFSAASFHGDDHERGELTATITYPANGATNADLSQPIEWMVRRVS
jgi:hypothetical protein